MLRILPAFLLCLFSFVLNAQDTLVTWDDEEILGKIVKIENKVVTIVLEDEPEKEYKIHTSELQRATYQAGNTIYFFDKYPDIITKMKKSSPRKNMIEISPLGPMFNHFYVGYERLIAKNQTFEAQVGVMAPMILYSESKLKGFQLNFAWKNIYSEPVRISGLSVRPKMQGAYIGFLFSVNYVSFSQDIVFQIDSLGTFYDQTRSTAVNMFVPTLHFVFGYNKMVAPAIMLGFCGGFGGGPQFVLSNDTHIKRQASLPAVPIGFQRFVASPFSMVAMFTCGILLK